MPHRKGKWNLSMASEALRWRVETFRTDFARVTGEPFKHFFCPILLTDDPDESAELCEGHIVPEAFGNSWVPQRKDVDNFYGSATEADAGSWMEKREAIFENWHTQSVQKLVPVRFEANGKTLEYYFPQQPIEVAGHTPAQFIGPDGKKVVDVMFKAPAHEVEALCGQDVQLVAERNFVPAMTGSILKAAHLTMFDMLGYDYVFSPTGQYLAAILRDFFLANKAKRNKRAAADEYFAAYASMVFPVMETDFFGGTANDQKGIVLWGASGRPFAIGVMVKMKDVLCALLAPENAEAIGTYQGYLKEPPDSVLIRGFRFVKATGESGSNWEIDPESRRFDLPHSKPWIAEHGGEAEKG
jgi:hypothetical protein